MRTELELTLRFVFDPAKPVTPEEQTALRQLTTMLDGMGQPGQLQRVRSLVEAAKVAQAPPKALPTKKVVEPRACTQCGQSFIPIKWNHRTCGDVCSRAAYQAYDRATQRDRRQRLRQAGTDALVS